MKRLHQSHACRQAGRVLEHNAAMAFGVQVSVHTLAIAFQYIDIAAASLHYTFHFFFFSFHFISFHFLTNLGLTNELHDKVIRTFKSED